LRTRISQQESGQFRRIVTGVAVMVVAAVSPLGAQTSVPPVTSQSAQSLSLSGTAAAGYDDNVLPPDAGQSSSQVQGGSYAATELGLNYAVQRRAISFNGNGFSTFRAYDASEHFNARTYGGSAGVSATLKRRVHVSGTGGASHSTQYGFWVFPGVTESPLGQVLIPLAPEYGLAAADVTTVRAIGSAGYDLTKRSALTFQYGLERATYDGGAFDLERRDVSGRYTLGLTRYATLHVGYAQQLGDYVSSGRSSVRAGSADVGVDYGRPLSFSRRTKVMFGATSLTVDSGADTYWTAGGHASLTHEFEDWTASLAYNRGVAFIDGFADPFITDAVVAGASGRLSRRVSITTSAGYSNGVVGARSAAFGDFGSYTGLARAEFALTRRLGLFSEYVYYHYLFGDRIALPGGTPRQLNRQGVRVGLTVVVPILKERTPRVTR
jgi:hypothetical protein